jgi:hypothetical protein
MRGVAKSGNVRSMLRTLGLRHRFCSVEGLHWGAETNELTRTPLSTAAPC